MTGFCGIPSANAITLEEALAQLKSPYGPWPRFIVGDKVEARGTPFYMVVTRVLRRGRMECKFGTGGGYAGVFNQDELSLVRS